MDYSSFQVLHDLLKDGIVEYIRGNGSSPNNSGNNSFFVCNGNISTEELLLLVFWLIVNLLFLVTLISASWQGLLGLSDPTQ